ncbi:uncharacterized protein G2W53_029349 [Senna tora]|uniref:Uncharacterized protein n=1 Tax=Senna tora TaxID=362788 RepID=A0A834T4E9_9FABA|nr:uncharacterized protein G2W53_029349 [Senna tora]
MKLLKPDLPINFDGMRVYSKVNDGRLFSATSHEKEEIVAEEGKEEALEKNQDGSPSSKGLPSQLDQLFEEAAQDSLAGDIIRPIKPPASIVPPSNDPAPSADPSLSSVPKAANGTSTDPLAGNEGLEDPE